jgi:hypothetical protein
MDEHETQRPARPCKPAWLWPFLWENGAGKDIAKPLRTGYPRSMLTDLDPPAPAARLWSRRRILLVFLAPLVVLALVFFFYDESLEPAPDLVPHWTGSGLGSGENGLERLRAAWGPLPEVDGQLFYRWSDVVSEKLPWDDALVVQWNPSGRNLRLDLTEALAAPEWVDRLKTMQDFLDNKSVLPSPCFHAMVATAMQKARAGDRGEAISLVRDVRRWTARQSAGSWSFDGLTEAMWWTWKAADLTCTLVEAGGFTEAELVELAAIWETEDLQPKDLANPVTGEAQLLAAIFRGEAGKEFRFGYWQRHGEIRPSPSNESLQTWLGLAIQSNATMNAMHRILRSVRDRGLRISPDRAKSFFEALQKERPSGSEWSLLAHPNAGGMYFLDCYVIRAAVYLEVSSIEHLFRIRAMRIWLALRRWALAQGGQLPATLQEMEPAFLTGIPLDPWDGSPLRWDPAGKMIYGVGLDWIANVPVPESKDRGWMIHHRDGLDEYTRVGLRYDRPPPIMPAKKRVP